METPRGEKKTEMRSSLRPIVGMAFVSLLLCGLFFPLLITGIAQAVFPYQVNGELVHLNGRTVGSSLIAENFTLPIFFFALNNSAFGVAPDITVQASYS